VIKGGEAWKREKNRGMAEKRPCDRRVSGKCTKKKSGKKVGKQEKKSSLAQQPSRGKNRRGRGGAWEERPRKQRRALGVERPNNESRRTYPAGEKHETRS